MSIESLIPWRRQTSLASRPMTEEFFPSITSIQREMNRMFNSIGAFDAVAPRLTAFGEEASGFFYPEIEMSESANRIEVTAELPGVSEKDIDVTLSPDGTSLSIKGEKKSSTEEQEKDYYYAERSYGAFRRTMSLPSPVNPDKVDARFKNGVLSISLKKSGAGAKAAKHIDIKK